MESTQKSLIELFDYNWQIKHTEKPLLFHYTGINALKKILESRELWASKSDFLNDYSETSYIIEVFSKVYDYVSENYNKEIASFFDSVRNSLVDYYNRKLNGNEYNSIFIISLSENPDSLVLWSNYSNVEGYNLCLETGNLLDVLDYQRQMNQIYDSVQVGKIIYEEEEQIKILFDEIMRIFRMFREHQNQDVSTKNEAIALCQVTIETYSMFFKKKAFEQEDEYRIAFLISDPKKIQNNIKYRIGNGSLVPYISIPIDLPHSPVFGVTVGPKNNTDTSVIGLRHFLKHRGYSEINNNIYKSMIPLRF